MSSSYLQEEAQGIRKTQEIRNIRNFFDLAWLNWGGYLSLVTLWIQEVPSHWA